MRSEHAKACYITAGFQIEACSDLPSRGVWPGQKTDGSLRLSKYSGPGPVLS